MIHEEQKGYVHSGGATEGKELILPLPSREVLGI